MNEIRKWLHSDVPEIRFSRGLVVGVVVSEIILIPIRVIPAIHEVRANLPPGAVSPNDGFVVIVIAMEAMFIRAPLVGILLTIMYFLVAPYLRRLFRKSARR